MDINLSFLGTTILGIERYKITVYGGIRRTLPDLMRTRYYMNSRPFTDDVMSLPEINCILEYDLRIREWFIVKS